MKEGMNERRKEGVNPCMYSSTLSLSLSLALSLPFDQLSCSALSPPCADYYPTYLDAAVTMKDETETKFAAVWVDDNPRLAARFFVPARLPYLVYAKDGDCKELDRFRFLFSFHLSYYNPLM